MASDRIARTCRLGDFRVGDWLVEPALCRLSRGDTSTRLRPQLMDLLVCLAARAGHVVLKDEIFRDVWPEQYVAESGLARCVAELRQALHDDAQEPRFIETIPKRGYRLIASVVLLEPDEPDATPPVPGGSNGRNGAAMSASAGDARVDTAPPATIRAAQPGPPSRRVRRWVVSVLVAAGLIAAVAAVQFWPTTPAALTPQDDLILCFENQTGEAVFDGTLELALAVQLEQSPYLRVVSPEHIAETLRQMGREPGTPMTRAVAGEVCTREGARALLAGSIVRLGGRYVLGLEAVACATGDVLAREQVQAKDKDEVLQGVGQMASRMRRKLGESLASVARYDVPITQATTGSLEALKAASLGDLERRLGRDESAAAHFRRAIVLDPEFALAYSRLGSALAGLGYAQESFEAVTKAYELRERTSQTERLEIEARYHQSNADFGKTIAALEALRSSHPRSSLARRGLAQTYALVGRYDEALDEALEAARLEPDGSQAHVTLALAYLHVNRFDEARKVAEAAVARRIDGSPIHSVLFDCAFVAGDTATMKREMAWAAGDPGARMLFLQFEAEAEVYGGRLRRATTMLQAAEALALERGDHALVADLRLVEAEYEALYGSRERVRMLVQEVLSQETTGERLLQAAVPLALAGEADRAARLVSTMDARADRPAGDFWQDVRAIVLAAVETSRGRPDAALDLLRPLAPRELGIAYEFLPQIVRGRAFLEAGQPGKAIAQFECVLAHRGLDPSSEMMPEARLGIARAHVRAGDAAAGREAYDRLFLLWSDADPDLPVLAAARRERRQLD